MNIFKLLLLFCISVLFNANVSAQAISSNPLTPTINDAITIRFDISKCSRKDLLNYSGDVYVHTGVKISTSTQWEYVIAAWDANIPKAKCTRISSNVYELTISPNLMAFYGVSSSDTVEQLAFVARSSDGTLQTEDLFVNIYKPGLNVEILKPAESLIVTDGTNIEIEAKCTAVATSNIDSLCFFADNILYHTSFSDTLKSTIISNGSGKHWIKIVAYNPDFIVADSIFFFVRDDINTAELPVNVKDGINYLNDSSVCLVLYAPAKEAVFAIGDFNNWEPDNLFLMNQTPDHNRWWLDITNLNKGEEYAFQYYIDGNIKVADPYCEKVLDPWNDKFISASTYPNLKTYPEGKTTGIVGVLQTAQSEYQWSTENFDGPEHSDLVIYELHIQNFTTSGNIKAVTDSLNYIKQLGINAIELMPVNEFEGNLSWGYNPSFYFAFDKTYGTKNDFKNFVDACHANGIAVIIDMVLNHSYSQSPLVQMYWDGTKVTAENPWYNINCPHSTWCWGYDFNHESNATQYFVDRVTEYWLTEYNVDGFRFDFTKGFTNKNDADAWGPDASRIAILKRIADSIREVKSDAIIIFEHLAENSEEKQLIDYGILLWGNINYNFNEATMGYTENNKSDFSWGVYSQRGWTVPGLVTYMESHDEERLMYKNLEYGNFNTIYDVKKLPTALQRMETAGAFFFTIPGPKMIWQWGELGYDYSINTCADGTVNDCRLDLKPIRWDYYSDSSRYRLYKVFEAFIDFKKTGLCSTTDFEYNYSGPLKVMHLNNSTTHAIILGNFGITNETFSPQFQHTGTWYNYMTGELFEVVATDMQIKLKPGEYYIYTDTLISVPDLPEAPELQNVPSDGDISGNTDFSLFPNPVAEGLLNLRYNRAEEINFKLKLFDVTGKLLFSEDYNLNSYGEMPLNLKKFGKQYLIYKIDTAENTFAGGLLIL